MKTLTNDLQMTMQMHTLLF